MKLKIFRNLDNETTRLFEERARLAYTKYKSSEYYQGLGKTVFARMLEENYQWPFILTNKIDWTTLVFSTNDVGAHVDPGRHWACGFCYSWGGPGPMGNLTLEGSGEIELLHGDFYILNAKVMHGFNTFRKNTLSTFLVSSIADPVELDIINTQNLVMDIQ